MDKLVGTELATFNLSQLTEDMLLRSDEPYEYLWSLRNDEFLQRQELTAISNYARDKFGIRDVKTTFEAYTRTRKRAHSRVVGTT